MACILRVPPAGCQGQATLSVAVRALPPNTFLYSISSPIFTHAALPPPLSLCYLHPSPLSPPTYVQPRMQQTPPSLIRGQNMALAVRANQRAGMILGKKNSIFTSTGRLCRGAFQIQRECTDHRFLGTRGIVFVSLSTSPSEQSMPSEPIINCL